MTDNLYLIHQALLPFAAEAKYYEYGDGSGEGPYDYSEKDSLNEYNNLTVGDLRRAREALAMLPQPIEPLRELKDIMSVQLKNTDEIWPLIKRILELAPSAGLYIKMRIEPIPLDTKYKS